MGNFKKIWFMEYPKRTPWFVCSNYDVAASYNLFCFPYAGGSASIFQRWQTKLNLHANVIAVEFPGKGTRLYELAISNLEELIDRLIPEILPFLNKPYLLFGHSNGSLVSYELARQMKLRGLRTPEHMFISAKVPPHKIDNNLRIKSTLPTPELVEELRKLNGTPEEILGNHELLEFVLPRIRADFSLQESYKFKMDVLLDCNFSLFAGIKDKIKVEQIFDWADLTNGLSSHHFFDGDHFFIHSQEDFLIAEIRKTIAALMAI